MPAPRIACARQVAHLLVFRCESCNVPIATWVISRDPGLGAQELDARVFHLICQEADCRWEAARDGRSALYRATREWPYHMQARRAA